MTVTHIRRLEMQLAVGVTVINSRKKTWLN